jgi:hypothetical protein
MSLFEPTTLACPACGTPVEFQAVASVNADRRSDLRDAILDRSFQREACPKCAKTFRLDPMFTYMDQALGLWMVVHPVADLGNWEALEQKDRATHDLAYGARASAAARAIGAALKPRVAFGWPAVREKVLAADKKLDDVTLELVKLAVLRGYDSSPLNQDNELRLAEVNDDQLVLAWIQPQEEEIRETLKVPRGVYDDIAADPAGWEALRAELTAGLFVDMHRLLAEPV